MEEQAVQNAVNAEISTQSTSLSNKLPRLSIQLSNLMKILSDESAIKIIREINKKARITDFYNAASQLHDELEKSHFQQSIFSEQFSQIASEFLDEIPKFKQELNESKKITKVHFYTKNLSDTIETFSKAVTNQLKKSKSQKLNQNKEFNVQEIINESDSLFINFQSKTEIKLKGKKDFLTVDMVKQIIETFQQYEEYQKSVWEEVCSSDKNWSSSYSSDCILPWSEQQFRFKGFLETVLHQLLFIAEFKERLTELENHLNTLIKDKKEIVDTDFIQKKPIAKFIFAKKRPFPTESDNTIIGKVVEVPTSAATPLETEMMEQRIAAFTDVVKQTKFCPKPYDRIAELQNENQRLNEIFNDGWVTSQQYDELKDKNEQLKQSIMDLNRKIAIVKEKLEIAKSRRIKKGKK